ncbi:hypothetical protein [Streptacidiphilus anmyonensis]|uniref:hypothetical protein n=1 Tax=Streptacidiphilus anmyonensis TaxID=405782 RepID=UPI0005A9776C|nr:hypothetical protein [Streptacidiphilus anmyonensis]
MSGEEKVIYDREWEVYRIRTAAGVLLGTEYGGNPCAYETRIQADDEVELRAERHAYLLREVRPARERGERLL